MAITSLNPLVTNIRGKVNHTVFSNNKSGSHCRARHQPHYTNSQQQVKHRQTLKSFAQGWGQGWYDRDSWNAYADTHPVPGRSSTLVKLSGFQMCAKMQLLWWLTVGYNTLTEPPSSAFTFPIANCTLVYTGIPPTLKVIIASSMAFPDNLWLNVFITPPMSPGRFKPKNMTLLVASEIPAPGPNLINSIYIAKYGPIYSGHKIFSNCRFFTNTGEAGVYMPSSIVIP